MPKKVAQDTAVRFEAIGFWGELIIASVRVEDRVAIYVQQPNNGMYTLWKRAEGYDPDAGFPDIITNEEQMDQIIYDLWVKKEEHGEDFTVYLHQPDSIGKIIPKGLKDMLRDGVALIVTSARQTDAGTRLTVIPRWLNHESLDTRAAVEFEVWLSEVRMNP